MEKVKLIKPVILLDIDGVFNALSKIDDRELIRHDYGTWQISKINLEFLKWLSKHFKCIWISTWQQDSNIINKYIGIKPFKYDYTGNKKDSVTRAIKKYKNILLVDDEYTDDRIPYIKPNQSTGLTEKDRYDIVQFYHGGKL